MCDSIRLIDVHGLMKRQTGNRYVADKIVSCGLKYGKFGNAILSESNERQSKTLRLDVYIRVPEDSELPAKSNYTLEANALEKYRGSAAMPTSH